MVLVGLFLNNVSNLQEAMASISHLQFKLLVCPIINPLHRSQYLTEDIIAEYSNFSSSDLILECKQWKKIIAKLNCDSIDCDSLDVNIRKSSEKLILQEIQLAQHLISRGRIMVKLTSSKNINLARILSNSLIHEICLVHLSITNISLNHLRRDLFEFPHQNRLNENDNDPWVWWNNFRIVCDYNPKFRLALELVEEPPTDSELNRWLGEPIECIIIPRHLFHKKHGQIGLPTEILSLIKKFLENKVYFILKGTLNEYEELDSSYDFLNNFLNNHSTNKQKDFNAGLEDKVSLPIQPMDYKKEKMYIIQECDWVFFKAYQDAIQYALIDRVPESEVKSKKSVLLIFGAVRGLLLKSAFNASKISNRKIKVYVFESNPANLITLNALKKELSWARETVKIISDFKQLDRNNFEGVDIFITSYIGSFGDNDLLPEILDEAKKYLKPNAISIPCQTTSYLNPIMSSRIFNNIKYQKDFKKEINGSLFENNYIIHLHNAYHIDEPKECFTFNYPDFENFNTKFACVQFKAHLNCILHGFAGYFVAVLYKNVTLSIHPQKFTEGLLSYYSYYFPIKDPQVIRAGEKIEINISRCLSTQRVWYEWQLNQPNILPIQNLKGKAFSIQRYRDE